MTYVDDMAELKAAALDEAKRAAGGSTGLARAIGDGITPQAVSQWKHVPTGRALTVERITGVPRYRLRPDIYPVPEHEVAA